MEKIIAQGAEARIILKDKSILKDRFPKKYRIKTLDTTLRKRRTRAEAKILTKLQGVIPVPKVLKENEKEGKLEIEYLEGEKIADSLDSLTLKEQKEVAKKMGEHLSRMHAKDIIHGDVTTSNMIMQGETLYFIDFGLGFHAHRYEDKAVDLHILKEALEAKHFTHHDTLFKEVLKTYNNKKINPDAEKILTQLKKVLQRGRYKDKY